MRIDKFLKVSRILKRRTLAQEACEKGKVIINGREAKSGNRIKVGDTVEITVNGRTVTLKGDSGAYVLAVWTDGTYAYSLSVSPGISVEDWYTVL